MASLKKSKSTLVSYTPAGWWAETWREGLFCGNGKIGANIFGGAALEQILLNHSDLVWQGRISVVPDVSVKISQVRKLIDEGEYEQAREVMQKALIQKNFRPQPHTPLPLCVLKTKMTSDNAPKNYVRELNMATGEATVSYSDGSTRIDRALFVSRHDDTVVYEITKTGGRFIDCELSFDLMDKINCRAPNALSSMPEGVTARYERQFMSFAARNDDGTEFGAVARVTHNGGNMEPTDACIKITGATSVLICVKLFVNSGKEKEWSALKNALSTIKETYAQLLKKHSAIHSKLFSSVSVDLDSAADDKPTDELRPDGEKGQLSPVLATKLWNLGRYLLLSATSQTGKTFNPYGLWNGSYKPVGAWVNYVGEMQSVYQSALAGDLASFLEPVFNFWQANFGDLRDNAIRLFGVRGAFLPPVTTVSSGRLGLVDAREVYFTGCAGWLAALYYRYYEFTKDQKFLKNTAFPLMREAAEFYLNLMSSGADGSVTLNPSFVPSCGKQNELGRNANGDFAVFRSLLKNLLKISSEVRADEKDVERWRDALEKLPSEFTDSEGLLRDFKMRATDFSGESTYSLFSAFASTDVDFLCNEETLRSYTATVKKRLAESRDSQTAMGMSSLAAVCARLGLKQQASDALHNLTAGCMLNNLVFSESDWRSMGRCGYKVWPQLMLSANIAFSGVVQEMLLYSKEGVLKVLPCLPSNWKNLEVKGLAAAGGLTVNMNLSSKSRLLNLEIKASKSASFDLYLPNETKKLKKSNVATSLDDGDLFKSIKNINLSAGKAATFVLLMN